MSTKVSSARPGFLRGLLGSFATAYDRRWLIKYFVQSQLTSGYGKYYLGHIWAFLGPLLMVVLLTAVFSEVLGIKFREVTGDSSLNFGLFLYCGLLPFLAFSQALTQGVTMIRRNSDLVTKVVFPLELLPLSQVTASLLQNSFGFAALLFILVVFEHRLHPTIFLLPLIMVPQLVFTCGLSYLISVLGTYVPDIRETLRAFVRAMFFMTPIIWPAGRVPEDYKWLVDYNPLTFLVEAYRNLILEGTLPFGEQAIYFCVVAVVLFVAGLALFNRVKHNFADLV